MNVVFMEFFFLAGAVLEVSNRATGSATVATHDFDRSADPLVHSRA